MISVTRLFLQRLQYFRIKARLQLNKIRLLLSFIPELPITTVDEVNLHVVSLIPELSES